jgi:major vault protein
LFEIDTKQKEAEIEVEKFQKTVETVGKETIVALARAGPEMQAKLLKGLGLKGFMVMDGKNPINLLHSAQGMIQENAQ